MSQSVLNARQPPWPARTLKSSLGLLPKRLRGHVIKHIGKLTVPEEFVADVPDRGRFAFRRNHWDLSRYFGMFELEESVFLKQVVGPGMQVIDVGANVGWYTALFFQRIGPQGKLLSIEPDPTNFARLEAYHALQGSPSHFHLLQTAVAEREGHLPLYLNADSGANTIVPALGETYGKLSRGVVDVPMTTLDLLVEKYGFSTIDFLKIDVERAEMLVLQGAAQTFRAGKVKRLFIEITDLTDADGINQTWKIDQFIRSFGFTGYTFEVDPAGKLRSLTEFVASQKAREEGYWRNVYYVTSPEFLPKCHSGS